MQARLQGGEAFSYVCTVCLLKAQCKVQRAAVCGNEQRNKRRFILPSCVVVQAAAEIIFYINPNIIISTSTTMSICSLSIRTLSVRFLCNREFFKKKKKALSDMFPNEFFVWTTDSCFMYCYQIGANAAHLLWFGGGFKLRWKRRHSLKII